MISLYNFSINHNAQWNHNFVVQIQQNLDSIDQ